MKTFWEYQEEQEGKDKKPSNKKSEEIIERERQEILESVSSYKIDTVKEKVAWVLNHFPETRDSDIALQLKYWEVFESHIYSGELIEPKDLYRLTKLTIIARTRATIQNDYNLFLASPEVREKRGTLSEEEKEKILLDKPNYPVFTVYIDDSGKNAQHLIIGSVWFLSDYREIHKAIFDLRERSKFTSEFHFKEMKKEDLPIYKDVIDVFWKHSSTAGFKLITIPRSEVKKTREAFADMYYHLLIKGIEHEQATNRAPLPRTLQVWIDAEESGLDQLLVANLDDRLRQVAKTRFDDKLIIDRVSTVDSKHNMLMQVADLFTGSINRIMNLPGTTRNHKDEFAKYFLNQFGFDLDLPENDKVGDIAVHIKV